MMQEQNNVDIERIQQAASLMARLWSDSPSDQDHHACETWRNEDPQNETAWQQLMNAQDQFGQVPKDTTQIINRSRQLSRRRLLGVMGISSVGLMASSIYQLEGNAPLMAKLMGNSEFNTATGEIKQLVLADNSQLSINTATVMTMPTANTFRLNHGEFILDSHGSQPYQIETPNGLIQLEQGRLHIRHTDQYTQISLYQGQPITVTGHHMLSATRLSAGDSMAFNAENFKDSQTVNPDLISWLKGKLVVKRMPLTDFIYELGRYRKGLIRISPELKHLLITGVFTLKDTDDILQQLQASFPIQLKQLTRYWVNISPV